MERACACVCVGVCVRASARASVRAGRLFVSSWGSFVVNGEWRITVESEIESATQRPRMSRCWLLNERVDRWVR